MVSSKKLAKIAQENKNRPAVASIAPSYLAEFTGKWQNKLVGLLRGVFNFQYIEETAVMLPVLLQEMEKLLSQSSQTFFINSSCPVVLEVIERDFPCIEEYISPLPSPMKLHGKYLKRKFGLSSRVFFFGPCPEKRKEDIEGQIDDIFTFREIKNAVLDLKVELDNIPEITVDKKAPVWARLAVLYSDGSGLEQCNRELKEIAEAIKQNTAAGSSNAISRPENSPEGFIELLACRGGCLYGPGTDYSGTQDNIKPEKLLRNKVMK